MVDDSLFEDPQRVADADTAGLLRSAALAGAQVRAATETAAEADLSALSDARPRALVLLARAGVAPAACRLVAALLGPSCPVPVVRGDSLPSWVGALDVVFAYSDDAGDSELAESLALAGRRGANVVLAAPSDGPVAASVAGRAWLLPPKIPVPPAHAFAHVLSSALSVVSALGLLRTDVDALADELDHEASVSHPRHETTTNPAKALALRLADHTPLLWGLDEVSTAVTAHAAFALGTHAGVPCVTGSHAQAATESALLRTAASLGSEADLFADPHEDEGARLRVFLLTTGVGETAAVRERAAVSALPGADVVTPSESAGQDVVVRSALLALRFDLASVYLGLASGTVDGPGWPVLAAH